MSTPFDIASNFSITTIVSVEELKQHDLIYIYHHIQVGSLVQLQAAGKNLKGDPRFRVLFKNFLIGYVTITGPVKQIFEELDTFEGEVADLAKQKFLPIREIDLRLQATKMRMVS